jgi:hypothetical protein
MHNCIALGVGSPYPLEVLSYEGAAAQFLVEPGNILQVMMPSIMNSELSALKNGKIRAGFITQGKTIFILFEIGDLLFECPFNPSIIPQDLISIPDTTTGNKRMAVDMHVIDTDTYKLCALRSFTLAPVLTKKLVTRAKKIRESANVICEPQNIIHQSLFSMFKTAKLYKCGV